MVSTAEAWELRGKQTESDTFLNLMSAKPVCYSMKLASADEGKESFLTQLSEMRTGSKNRAHLLAAKKEESVTLEASAHSVVGHTVEA